MSLIKKLSIALLLAATAIILLSYLFSGTVAPESIVPYPYFGQKIK